MYIPFYKYQMPELLAFKKSDPACRKLETINIRTSRQDYQNAMTKAQESMQNYLDILNEI